MAIWAFMAGIDWKLFTSTFIAIFLAELGDKTQLATLSLSAGGASRWVIFFAASLALVATSAVAVLAGDVVAKLISPVWLQRAAAVMFVVLGVVMFAKSRSDAPKAPTETPASNDTAGRDGR